MNWRSRGITVKETRRREDKESRRQEDEQSRSREGGEGRSGYWLSARGLFTGIWNCKVVKKRRSEEVEKKDKQTVVK